MVLNGTGLMVDFAYLLSSFLLTLPEKLPESGAHVVDGVSAPMKDKKQGVP